MIKIDIDNKEIAKLYLSGKTMKEIAEIYNVSIPTIKNRLDKENVKRRTSSEVHKKYKFNEEEMIQLYLSGKNLIELGQKYNVGYVTIKLRLVEHGVKLRTRSESKKIEFQEYNPNKHGRKFFLNHKYFQNWNKNMAYIVGFLSADGYVSNKGTLKITLQEKDIELLYKINKELESSYPVKKLLSKCGDKYHPSCELLINSKHMVNDLINIGVTQRKSFTIRMDDIPNKYRIDFIRGYFDGDGSVGEQWSKKSKKPMLRVRIFSGSQKLLYQIVQELYLFHVPMVNVRKSKGKELYNIEYSQKASEIIYNLFYGDNPEIYLTRKRIKFEEILEKQKS